MQSDSKNISIYEIAVFYLSASFSTYSCCKDIHFCRYRQKKRDLFPIFLACFRNNPYLCPQTTNYIMLDRAQTKEKS